MSTEPQYDPDELLAVLRTREALRPAVPDDGGEEAVSVAAARMPSGVGEEYANVDTEKLIEILTSTQKVIYGVDDRQDLFQVTDPALLDDADCVVAIFRSVAVTDNGNGTSTLNTQNFGTAHNLCQGERFRDQPIGAFCSGFLVGPDIVATAGHCVDASTVTNARFVFGFRMTNATTAQTTINNSEIYRGTALLGRQLVQSGADWALVRLDREVHGHTIADVRRIWTVPNNEAVHVIGHPVGLPIKVAGGANVRDNGPAAFFVANLDTYGGNSGSPVFNSGTHQIEGILVRGETDFTMQGNCRVSLVCPNTGCRGEDVTRTTEFVASLPAWRHESAFGPKAPDQFQNYAPGNFNYELVARSGTGLQHHWFSFGGDWQWHKALAFGSGVESTPAMFQNVAPNNANYELVVREGSKLQHYWFSFGGDWQWHKGLSFGSNVTSPPVMFQNNAPGNYNYEVVVREGTKLQHYWFSYGGDWQWHKGLSFGSNVTSAPAMFQNRAPGNHNYELVVREGTKLQHYWFSYGGDWQWHKALTFGADGQRAPVIFQNHAPGNYNYELIVREGGKLQHYWFSFGGDWQWHKALAFGANLRSQPTVFQNYARSNYNYEVVVREQSKLQHYWFAYGGDWQWHKALTFGTNVEGDPSMFQNRAPVNRNYELIVPESGKLQHYWFSYGGDWQWHKALAFTP
jgi:hypothetical protein